MRSFKACELVLEWRRVFGKFCGRAREWRGRGVLIAVSRRDLLLLLLLAACCYAVQPAKAFEAEAAKLSDLMVLIGKEVLCEEPY